LAVVVAGFRLLSMLAGRSSSIVSTLGHVTTGSKGGISGELIGDAFCFDGTGLGPHFSMADATELCIALLQ
jgi:hypothetical protein